MALTKVTGELIDIGDLDLSDVGTISLDAIQGDADANTSITFSGSDVITIATGGSGRLTIGDGALSPVTNNQIDLGTASLEFKNAFFDGTVTADAFAGPLTGNVTGNASGTALTVTQAAQTAITSVGTLTALTVDNLTLNGSSITSDSNLTMDVTGDINLDAAGNQINLKNDGTTRVTFELDATPEVSFTGGNLAFNNLTQDADIAFKGYDGASFITALNLDMSAAGAATFNAGVTATSFNGITSKTFGTGSIMIGDSSTGTIDAANNNTGLGVNVFEDLTTGDDNVGVGSGALGNNTTGNNNVAIGYQALYDNIGGHYNVAVGWKAGFGMATGGDGNIMMGYDGGRAITTGDNNVALGIYAMGGANSKTGSNNVCVGSTAGNDLSSGSDNVLVGSIAGSVINSGSFNTSIGRDAHRELTTGSYNVAIGNRSGGYSDTGGVTGSENVTIGRNSGYDLSSGEANVCIGSETGFKLNNDSGNVHIGQHAGRYRNGGPNTFVGYWAGRGTENNGSTGNTGIGNNALTAIVGGTNNAVLGHNAGAAITSGHSNTCIGYATGDTIQSGNNNVLIGNSTDCAHDSAYAIAIGPIDGQGDYFKFGKGSNIVSNQFTSDAAWARSSDERLKQDIKEDTLGLSFINDLNTVTYRWKPSNEIPQDFKDYNEENQKDTEVVMHGMLAQEVKAALDTAGVETFSGWTVEEDGMQNISREMFVIPLIKAIQELSAEVEQLKQQAHEKCEKG